MANKPSAPGSYWAEDVPARKLQPSRGWSIYEKAKQKNADVRALQMEILEVGDCFDLQRFAADIPRASHIMCRFRVMSMADGWQAYWFASEIPDSEALQSRVMSHGCAKTAYLFSCDIPRADIRALHAFASSKAMQGLTAEEINHFDHIASLAPPSSGAGKQASESKQREQEILARGSSLDAFEHALATDGADIRALYTHAYRLKFSGMTMEQCLNFKAIAEAYLVTQKRALLQKQNEPEFI